MFNKDEYWKNRKAGKRGQGELPKAELEEVQGQHMVQIGQSLQFTNRKTARRYASGTKKAKPELPNYDPNETNHQRVQRQRKLRALRKDQERLRELAEKDAE